MTARSTCIQLAVGGLLFAGIGTRPAVAQGPGVSAGIGIYRTNSTYFAYEDPGTGAELMGQWTFSSGMVVGLGARVISYFRGERYSAFLDGRYAPPPTPTHRLRPILGVRAGPYADDSESDPLVGVEGGPIVGLALRMSAGWSLTLAGDLTVVIHTNDYANVEHRFIPGLVLGVTIH